jgi:hypothetical protein
MMFSIPAYGFRRTCKAGGLSDTPSRSLLSASNKSWRQVSEHGEVKSPNHLLGTSIFLFFQIMSFAAAATSCFHFYLGCILERRTHLPWELEKVLFFCNVGRGPGRSVYCREATGFHGPLCLPSIFFFHLLLKFVTILRNEETRSRTDWKCERI